MKTTLLLLAAMTLGGATAASAATSEKLPACSKTVTKHCVTPASAASHEKQASKHEAATKAPKMKQHS